MIQRLSLSEDLYPIEAFFNVLTDEKLLKALSSFSEGRGYNPEDKTCDFPADLAEDEGGPEGRFDYIEVWTYANNQEVRVPFLDFSKYILSAVDAQILLDSNNKAMWEEAAAKAVAALKNIERNHVNYEMRRLNKL
ncbi:MAG: hypothetical protein ABJN34_03300 [Litoreibacter sp.]|uniref:hypothetical protein n=1 Tax=Litoreibacter sp. TaxID=1969459 RepID=UPI003298481F